MSRSIYPFMETVNIYFASFEFCFFLNFKIWTELWNFANEWTTENQNKILIILYKNIYIYSL